MKLSEVKKSLENVQEVRFVFPNGTFVPVHFHVTEVGVITKNFIDCGGTVREEKVVNFQLWEANDFDHRLAPQKLKDIIELSEKVLNLQDGEVEVEYQQETIGKFHLSFDGVNFLLEATQTNCLAQDKCGIPADILREPKDTINQEKIQNTCTPGGGCC